MGLLDYFRSKDNTDKRAVVTYSGADTSGAWLFGGTRSDSGVVVTKETALGLDTLWAGVRMVATDIGRMPLKVYKRKGSTKEAAAKHPAYHVLHDEPNPESVPLTFWQTVMGHAMLNGNAYIWIDRNGYGDPASLWILIPEETYPVRVDSKLYYETLGEQGRRIVLDGDDVLHIKNMSPDGLIGYNVIDLLKNAIGGSLATRKYANVYFENNGRPSVVIQFPEGRGLKDKEAIDRFRNSWASLHGGAANSHRPAILEDGANLADVKITAKDAQLIEKANLDIKTIANVLNIPAHKIGGEGGRTSYSSLESENLDYLSRLDGWLVMIEQECSKKLTRTKERKTRTHFVEFERGAFLRADKKTETEVLVMELNNGLRTRNEIRDIKNLPHFEQDEADIPLMPVNHAPLGQQVTGQEPDNTGQEETEQDNTEQESEPVVQKSRAMEDALRSVTYDTIKRMFGRLTVHAERAAKKPGTYNDSIDAIAEKHGETVRAALEQPLSVVFCFNGSTNAEAIRRDFVADFTQAAIEAGDVSAEDLAESVGLKLVTFSRKKTAEYGKLLFGSS